MKRDRFVALIALLAFSHINTTPAAISSSLCCPHVRTSGLGLCPLQIGARHCQCPYQFESSGSNAEVAFRKIQTSTLNAPTNFSNGHTLPAILFEASQHVPVPNRRLGCEAASIVSTNYLFESDAYAGQLVHAIFGVTLVIAYQY